jgi:hypothetical protein
LANNKRFKESIKRFRSEFLQEWGENLFNVLRAQDLESVLREEAPSWRDRLYAPLTTLRLLIEQVLHPDAACQEVVVRYASERAVGQKARISLSTGPYCKARQRLPLGLMMRLGKMVGERLEEVSPSQWKWRGRSVKLVDGTTVSMPDTAQNQKRYPQTGAQKPGLGFPLARLLAVISLGSGAVLGWAMGPCKGKGTGEDSLFRQLYGVLNKNDVVLVDRYHSSYFTLAWLRSLGVDVVTRQHHQRETDFRKGQRLGKGDHLVSWKRPQRPNWMDQETYHQMPEEMKVREAKRGEWIIVSTLIDAKEVSQEELHALYVQRWHVELDLRAVKNVMGMDVLRCKSPEMVIKEVSAFLLGYNLIRATMAQAAAYAKVLPRTLSFSGAKRVIVDFLNTLKAGKTMGLKHLFAYLRGAIATLRLPYRPHRVEPRAIKRRPKPHRLLTQPRNIARAKLRSLRAAFA